MTSSDSKTNSVSSNNFNPFDLSRFIEAQSDIYEQALKEIRQGHKTTHWVWYIFPQLKGLGRSQYATYYGIKNLDEAKAYLKNSTLRSRLLEISNALLELDSDNIEYIMGSPIDTKKLQSSMTLFHFAAPEEEVFTKILAKFYDGKLDQVTKKLLN